MRTEVLLLPATELKLTEVNVNFPIDFSSIWIKILVEACSRLAEKIELMCYHLFRTKKNCPTFQLY